jgi:hypothetical protein
MVAPSHRGGCGRGLHPAGLRVVAETLDHAVVDDVAIVVALFHMLSFQRHGPPVRLFLGIIVGGVFIVFPFSEIVRSERKRGSSEQ